MLLRISNVKTFAEANRDPVKREIDDRRCIERQNLAHDESADDRDSEWAAQFGADAGS